ncbi:hypothetical protein [Streptomyces sp. NPDC058045]|uniref:hypothetical protein n=1 Tax=Streptomyces sp. NPDC058045 TaxID=3346311 RepID=UPI0036ED15CA
MLLLLGLLLMAGAAAFAGLLIAYNLSGSPDYTVTLLGSQPFTISTLGAFLGGIALTLIFGLGMWMLLAGSALVRGHGRRRRVDRAGDDRTVQREARLGGTGSEGSTRTAATGRSAHRRSHRLRLHGH